MNKEKQRIAIAEACGIVGPFDNRWIKEYEEEGGDSYGFTGFEKGELVFIPDYLTDLNAMHEAEMSRVDMEDGRFIVLFREYLHTILGHDGSLAIHATGIQRAEAFLRTIGKWEDDK
jgi:hypothetical protein